jgi:hypothetical protein
MKYSAPMLVSLLLSSVSVSASETCGYASAVGTEIIIAEDAIINHSLSTDRIFPSPSSYSTFDAVKGKKSKILSKPPVDKSGKPVNTNTVLFHELLSEDCLTFYWMGFSTKIDREGAESKGVRYLELPATEWVSEETVDRMTDVKSCTVKGSGIISPIFLFTSNNEAGVTLSNSSYPGKPITFRVDKNKAITGEKALLGESFELLLSQIRAGGKGLLVSAYMWPSKSEIVKDVNLAGAIEKIDYCINAVKK